MKNVDDKKRIRWLHWKTRKKRKSWKVNLNRVRLIKGVRLLVDVTVAMMVYTGLLIIYALLGQGQIETSENVLAFHYVGDWIIFAYEVFAILAGGFLAWFYLWKRHDCRRWFWAGNLGWLTGISALLALIMQGIQLAFAKNTTSNIKAVVKIVTAEYYLAFGLFIIFALVAAAINRRWFTRNNWYAFWVLAPYVLIEALLYRYYNAWMTFTHLKKFSYSLLHSMFRAFEIGGINAQMNLTLMNDVLGLMEALMFIGGALFLLYGGMLIVWKTNQGLKQAEGKFIERYAEAKQASAKETSQATGERS